jgi:hypothetical protein
MPSMDDSDSNELALSSSGEYGIIFASLLLPNSRTGIISQDSPGRRTERETGRR